LISLRGPGAMTMTAGISFRCIISAVPVVLLLDHCASCFTNLKKLKLDGVSVPGHLQCLLPECAVLEWLSIVRCTLHGLQTSQPLYRLRYLRVQHCEGMRKVEIQAPNFDVFKFHDSPMAIVLNGCLALAEATVALLASSDCFNYAFTELPSGILCHWAASVATAATKLAARITKTRFSARYSGFSRDIIAVSTRGNLHLLLLALFT